MWNFNQYKFYFVCTISTSNIYEFNKDEWLLFTSRNKDMGFGCTGRSNAYRNNAKYNLNRRINRTTSKHPPWSSPPLPGSSLKIYLWSCHSLVSHLPLSFITFGRKTTPLYLWEHWRVRMCWANVRRQPKPSLTDLLPPLLSSPYLNPVL